MYLIFKCTSVYQQTEFKMRSFKKSTKDVSVYLGNLQGQHLVSFCGLWVRATATAREKECWKKAPPQDTDTRNTGLHRAWTIRVAIQVTGAYEAHVKGGMLNKVCSKRQICGLCHHQDDIFTLYLHTPFLGLRMFEPTPLVFWQSKRGHYLVWWCIFFLSEN